MTHKLSAHSDHLLGDEDEGFSPRGGINRININEFRMMRENRGISGSPPGSPQPDIFPSI